MDTGRQIMEKAYDVKELLKRLEKRGKSVLEVALVAALDELHKWGKESAELSKTPIDDVAMSGAPVLVDELKEEIDKIDGEDG